MGNTLAKCGCGPWRNPEQIRVDAPYTISATTSRKPRGSPVFITIRPDPEGEGVPIIDDPEEGESLPYDEPEAEPEGLPVVFEEPEGEGLPIIVEGE